MRIIIATAAFLALATGAQAYCYSAPDTAETHYGDNGLRRTLCLQNELVQSTNQRVQKQLLDQTLSKLQRDLQQHKLLLQQLQTELALDEF